MPERHPSRYESRPQPRGELPEAVMNMFRHFNSYNCLTPHINVEDLLKPNAFLAFLNVRGRYRPHHFSHVELLNGHRCGWNEGYLWEKLDGYAMEFLDRRDPSSYAKLIPWINKQDAVDTVRSGRALHPATGFLVLRIQNFTSTILRRAVEQILYDVPTDIFACWHLPVNPEPSALSTRTDYSNIGYASLEHPYRLPAALDFRRMHSLISARIDEIEDHLWSLREDPNYFSETLRSVKQHRPEYARDVTGRKSSLQKRPPEVLLRYVIRDVVLDGYYLLHHWCECQRQVVALQELELKYAVQTTHRCDLPEEYAMAFKNLWHLLHNIMTDTQFNIRKGLVVSPALHPYYEVKINEATASAVHWKLDKKIAGVGGTVIQLFHYLHGLMNSDNPPLDGRRADLDELERFLEYDSSAKDMISPCVQYFFSQLSVACQCVHQIQSYQPWATKIRNDMESRVDDKMNLIAPDVLYDNYQAFTRRWTPVLGWYFTDYSLARLADPSDGKFDYPVGQHRNRTNVRRMREAEANLDRFWRDADAYCKLRTGKSWPGLLDHDIIRGRRLQRTAPWVDPPKSRKRNTEPAQQTPQYSYQPFSLLDHDESSEITGSFSKILISDKPKSKTRGTADPLVEDPVIAEEQDIHDPVAIQHPKYLVDKRAHRVFKILFHSQFSNDTPGEIAWTDFLHAMVNMGFPAEKLHGSAWHFSPTTSNIERSIQFHEPHGSTTKLPKDWARRYGGRLKRAFGWEGDMFKLA
ncbi:hypothetical protein BDV95DRAFT_556591 [Massariosphaeria phaeospora]|uniref:Uncharacterized protein n=1 Tax=Massariosphaeria phaeospora TaxID=100035 RepID=A0A7C8IFE4_9PLEO|nr:hypothetical protein BDV95DRAFT_556591 [Massariosphaeria phaeospora]